MERAPQPAQGAPTLGRKQLAALAAASFVAASITTALFVMPFEYGVDPSGFGRAVGLLSPVQPPPARDPAATQAEVATVGPEQPARTASKSFRSDFVEIQLASPDAGPHGYELEYKVAMQAGDTLVYSWTVAGVEDPEEFYFDFHGETPAGPDNPKPIVTEYLQQSGTQSHGSLTAPISGVHGWYLQNQSGGTALVRLRLSGFYELIEPGAYGNLARIKPTESWP